MPLIKRLRHAHVSGIIPYHHAEAAQELIVSRFKAFKATSLDPRPLVRPLSPVPVLLSFTPTPVYTLGRREIDTLNAAQIQALEAPFYSTEYGVLYPKTVQTQRGGQITFHGPGQLVLFPVIDLRPNNLTPRDYVKVLEEVTIKVLSRYGIVGQRTDNPGVWVIDKQVEATNGLQVKGKEREKKIAALGVHLRRNITSYGVGLNLGTDLKWFDRIVACGLAGKGVTSVVAELAKHPTSALAPSPAVIASLWANEFATRLWVSEGEVQGLQFVDFEPTGGLERLKKVVYQPGYNATATKR